MRRESLFRRNDSATHVRLRGRLGVFFAAVLGFAGPCGAADLEVAVKDKAGMGLPGVVVTVSTQGAAGVAQTGARTPDSPVMDQINMRFVPEVLVVPLAASVRFPNSDTVSHQVYSFSSPKRFQLPLYKSAQPPPISFDKPGLVVVGCNIHDQMVGYIYVTDAPWFGQTDANGALSWGELPAGQATITIWSPRIADDTATLTRTVNIAANDERVEFRLSKSMRAQPEPRPRNPNWDY